jgi:uncharacterized protein with FMN-binding domain
MRRAILVGAGTVAGVAAVLGYHPGSLFTTPAAQAADITTSAAGATTTATTGSASSTAASASGSGKSAATSKTYTGDTVQTRFGPVQVEVTVRGSKITKVNAIASPNGDPHSAQISAYAIPQLRKQAMAAQSASISGVSGASYTSQGFEQSLQSALAQAGLA